VKADALTSGISNLACSSAILIDDMINGNVTNDGTTFFIGMSPLSNQIDVLNSNIGSINTTLYSISNSGSNMTSIKAQATLALSDIAKIPSGVDSPALLTLTYMTPLDNSAPSVSISS
jgi:hypothetical protein